MNSSVRTSVHLEDVLLIDSEFDFRVVGDGRSAAARYANNSNYRNDSLIRKESTSAKATFRLSLLTRPQCASAPL
jgi:hypothetical protein